MKKHQVKFNNTVNLYYEDGTVDENVAVTGWLVSELNKDEIEVFGKKVSKVEKVK